MKIKDIMTSAVTYVPETTTLQEVAQKMLSLDCGFIPVGNTEKLLGVITDRDIVTRGVAKGLAPTTKVTEVMTTKVLYCYETDSTQDVAKNMSDNQVRRLIVLTNSTEKKLCGVVSVCDIVTANKVEAETSSQLIKCLSSSSSAKSSTKAA